MVQHSHQARQRAVTLLYFTAQPRCWIWEVWEHRPPRTALAADLLRFSGFLILQIFWSPLVLLPAVPALCTLGAALCSSPFVLLTPTQQNAAHLVKETWLHGVQVKLPPPQLFSLAAPLETKAHYYFDFRFWTIKCQRGSSSGIFGTKLQHL